MKSLWKVFPHAAIVLSSVFVVFLILDHFNPTMNFVNNSISTFLLGALCAASFVSAVILVFKDRAAK
ncbi:MAG TPA: hypothetical protein PL044_09275 [Clostridiales bacterium]|nr:MAG: hypothetical protein BWY37_00759 [Firmicutes bacterium ADurb.Bin262]HOU09319.1 hypothetical protein [Clostridiales bacterium]HQH63589.1 hypothetical protein [Clostridiales bacterium]HQK73943.1 hypothetical protein [Clostridiales bacterium]